MAETSTIKIKKILEAGKVVYPATILDAVKDAKSVKVEGEETNKWYGKTLREILADQASAGSAEVDALDKKLHGDAAGTTDEAKAGELATLESSVKAYTDAEIDKLDATNNVSDTVAGVAVKVDEVNGVVSKPVVTVADNAVTYTAKVKAAEGVEAVDRNLAAADTAAVLKGDAIAAIKDYVDATVAEAGSDAADDLEALETKLYGEDGNGGDVKDINNAIAALEATHAKEGDTFKTVAEEVNEAVTGLVNGAPAALDTLKEIADWIANQNETGVTDATSLVSRVNDLVTEIGDDDTEESVKGRIAALESVNAAADFTVTDTVVATQYVSGVSQAKDGKITVTRADLPTLSVKTDSTNYAGVDNHEIEIKTSVLGNVTLKQVDGTWTVDEANAGTGLATAADVATEIVNNEKVVAAALNNHEGRVVALETANAEMIHTTVADKTAGHITVATNADTKVVTISEAADAVVTFDAEAHTLASDSETAVVNGSAIAAVKSYVDDRFSTEAIKKVVGDQKVDDDTEYDDVF